jgi:hypothetical protein
MFALGQLNALADGGWLICGLALECQEFYWDGLAMVGAQGLPGNSRRMIVAMAGLEPCAGNGLETRLPWMMFGC